MAEQSSSLAVDLSRLAPPRVIQALSFETILADMVADFRTRVSNFDALLESDPALKLLEAAAYRELLVRAEINDAAASVLLAFAGAGDLDHLAAFYGITRLVIRAATEQEPAVLEPDEDLRFRAQLAPELLAHAGLTAGGYRGLALRAAPSVKDVAVLKGDGGRIDLVLLGRDGPGTLSSAVIADVAALFGRDDAVGLTDVVSVQAAAIVAYSAAVTLRIGIGPDPELVRGEAERAIRAYALSRHRVGQPVYAQMIEAAASVGGVERASVDIADVVPGPREAAWLAALVVTVVVAA